MKVLTVVGARPQFVKAAVVSREIRRREGVTEVIVHTGQHYDRNMSAQFFEELGIPEPDHNLGVGSASHGTQTAAIMQRLEPILLARRPDRVLVYGDTNSTLAGALTAAKLHVPVAHVEAGLRSFNRRMPEELNRVLTDHASDLLFAPTDNAYRQLLLEGIPGHRIRTVGDVMLDAALHYASLARSDGVLARLGIEAGGYALATVHRAENTDDHRRLRNVLAALARLAESVPVVLPLHPRTHRAVAEGGLTDLISPLLVTEPLGYPDMLRLERDARLIVTDSGGVQKEAYFFGVPCVTVRDETEWVETVQSGWNVLASPDHEASMLEAIERQRRGLDLPRPSFYGDGTAAKAIVDALLGFTG